MIKKLLFALLGLIAVLVGAVITLNFIAPKNYKVEREITINKPKADVYNYARMLGNQDTWGPWAKKDPAMKKEKRGTDGTVGFVAWWSGNDEVGEGEQEIKKLVEGERMETELRFKKPFEGKAGSWMTFEAAGETQTKVKWGVQGDMPFPGNIFGYLMNMNKMMTDEFDEGLKGLKAEVEKS
jgi:hypothetical protein